MWGRRWLTNSDRLPIFIDHWGAIRRAQYATLINEPTCVIRLQGAAQKGFDYIFSPLASSCWTTAESAPVASSLCKCLMTSSLSEVTEPSEKYDVKVIVDDTFSGLNNMMKMLDCWYCS